MLSLATGIPRHRLGLLERQVEDPTTVERDVIAKVLQIPNEKLIRGDEPQFNSEISFGDGEL
jgi:hypothetical protein